MAHQVRMLATIPDDLSSSLVARVFEGDKQLLQKSVSI